MTGYPQAPAGLRWLPCKTEHERFPFRLPVERARLLEMTARYRNCALVIEANYSDLVNPKKARFYSAGLVADVIAELAAAYPGLQVAFCSNRKFAAEWVERYFTRIARQQEPPVTTSDR